MRIVIIIELNPFYQNSAGANRWRTLIEGLTALNVDIHLLVTNGYNSIVEYKKLGLNGQIQGVQYTYLNILFHHNVWLKRLNRYILNPFFSIFNKWRVRTILNKTSTDFIWTSTSLANFQLVYWLKKQKVANLFFLEMSEFLDIHQINKSNFLQIKAGNNRQNFFEKKAFNSYDGIALMTKTLMHHYKSFPHLKTQLLHLPMTVDLSRFSDKTTKSQDSKLNKPYIAFVGVMNNAKEGIDILIEAFAKVSEKFPEISLYCYGFYHHDVPSQLERIKVLGLSQKIKYMGVIDRDQIPSIINNATLLVLPRPNSKQAEGGFPTKLGEYLATANPVCVTRVGEIPQYLKDKKSAFLAKASDINDFANTMMYALNNPDLAIKVGKEGRAVAEKHFNKEIQAQILFDFLEGLLKNKTIQN